MGTIYYYLDLSFYLYRKLQTLAAAYAVTKILKQHLNPTNLTVRDRKYEKRAIASKVSLLLCGVKASQQKWSSCKKEKKKKKSETSLVHTKFKIYSEIKIVLL